MNIKYNKIYNFGKTLNNIVIKEFNKSWKVKHLGKLTGKRGVIGDLTKTGDTLVEQVIIKNLPILLKTYHIPGAILVTEETGVHYFSAINKPNTVIMIVDPVDGSNNLRPFNTVTARVAFSLGLTTNQELLNKSTLEAINVSFVSDLLNNKIFSAIKGNGAFLNNKKINTSILTDIHKAIIGTGLDHQGQEYDKIYNKVKKIIRETHCLRRIGSTILDLMSVATGENDAYISISGGIKLNDIGAAPLIIKEANGLFKYSLVYNHKYTDKNYLNFLLHTKGDKAKLIYGKMRFKIIAANNLSLYNNLIKLLPKKEQKLFK